MYTARGRVVTTRAGVYLMRICEHLQQINEVHERRRAVEPGHASDVTRVEWTDTYGLIEFDSGQCELHATGTVLTLHLSANGDAELARLQTMFTNRISTIGRRDGIDVSW